MSCSSCMWAAEQWNQKILEQDPEDTWPRAQRPLTWHQIKTKAKSEDTFGRRPAEREEDKNGQIMSKSPSQQTVSFSCCHSHRTVSLSSLAHIRAFRVPQHNHTLSNDRPLNIYMSKSKNTCNSSILYYRLWYKIRHFCVCICVWARVHNMSMCDSGNWNHV